MKKAIILLVLIILSTVLFAADDVEIVLSGNASTDHFAVKDNSSNTIFMVRGNSVINIPTLSSAPSGPSEGDIYTNSTDHNIYYYDGTSWVDLTSVVETDPTLTDDQYVTIGDNGSNAIQLTFDGNGSNDGMISWDPTTNNFDFVNLGAATGSLVTMTLLSNGIINMPVQSAARAYQYDPNNPNLGQVIAYNSWTAVYYQNINYDNQSEFTTGATAGSSYFTVTEPGLYQINARLDFALVDAQGNIVHNPNYQGYVSIAIFDVGTSAMLSQGNKLQGADNDYNNWNDMQNNLAPNVSDVLYLTRGQQIEIRAYQNLYSPNIPLRTTEQNGTTESPAGSPQVYVSIHKIS